MSKPDAVLRLAVKLQNAEFSAVNDRELLQRYVQQQDQAAFSALVSRHSAMIYGVCRRVLHSDADAEDASQAVFVVLSKKANGVRWKPSLANWLYTTARKVAQNARSSAVRRSRREGAVAVPESISTPDSMTSQELLTILDEELEKLSPRYREPLVLCYLEGLTRDEAAERLGLPVLTLKIQLERGRK